jgi:Ni/Co efflux regulator RcnB
MNKILTACVATLAALSSVVTAVPASAQPGREDHRDRGDRNRGDHRGDQRDERGGREWRGNDNRGGRGWHGNNPRAQGHRWQYYGGNYGYNGYQGQWRAGQRYPHYRDRGYYVNNYYDYGLPAPRRGYRYYRADNGDIVMVAIASGIIGLIIGGALAR